MSITSRVRALLAAPKAIAVLAELGGRPVDIMAATIPGAAWEPRDWPRSSQGSQVRVTDDMRRALDDAEALLTLATRVVSDWRWTRPREGSARRCCRPPTSTRTWPPTSAPAARWWWQPCDVGNQVMLTGSDREPDTDAANVTARLRPFEHPDLPYPALVTTSTRAGPQLPAAHLRDIDLVARLDGVRSPLDDPIRCWHVAVSDESRICEIRTPADWLRLCERYPRRLPPATNWDELGLRARSRFGPIGRP